MPIDYYCTKITTYLGKIDVNASYIIKSPLFMLESFI